MHMKLLNIKKNWPYMVVQGGHVKMAIFYVYGHSCLFLFFSTLSLLHDFVLLYSIKVNSVFDKLNFLTIERVEMCLVLLVT